MSIKTRVKKLEEKSNNDFKVIFPRVRFFDEDGNKLESTENICIWPDEVQIKARQARVSLDDVEPILVERNTTEDFREFRDRIDQACSDVCAATSQTGIFLHWGVKYL